MGAGSAGAGVGPAGQDPVADPSAAPPIRPAAAVWYDGANRDFLLDDDGGYKTLHYVDQKVALALVIGEGDIAGVPTFGSRLKSIKRGNAAQLAKRAEDAVLLALADIISRRQIEVIGVSVNTNVRGRLIVTVTYNNLLLPSNQQQTATVSA